MRNRRISVYCLCGAVILAVQTVSLRSLGSGNIHFAYAKAKDLIAQQVSGTEVGIGWSERSDPREALKEALGIALEGKRVKQPQVAVIFGSAKDDIRAVLSEAKNILGSAVKIYGGVTDPGIVDQVAAAKLRGNRGYLTGSDRAHEEKLKIEARGFVVMTLTSGSIAFGAGYADVSRFSSLAQAAKATAENAVRDTGKDKKDRPKVVLLTSAVGEEDKIAREISGIVGNAVLILGGSERGNKFSVFSGDGACANGISIGLIYTDLPLGCNLVQLAYNKLNKPDPINNMFGIRRPIGESAMGR